MELAWIDFVKAHIAARPFKSHGWVHLSKMEQLMPETVKGNNVFRPSQGILGMDTYVDLNQSQEWDDTLPDDDEPSQPSQEGPPSGKRL